MSEPILITATENGQTITLALHGDNLVIGAEQQLLTVNTRRLPALLSAFRQLDQMRDFRRVANDLSAHLLRLADMTEKVQQYYEEGVREEEDDPNWESEYQAWFSLEKESEFVWTCGWCVREDESTVWAWNTSGATPLEAAQALLKELERL